MLKVYGIKNCETVKKTIKYLIDNNLDYSFIDLKKEIVDDVTLQSWVDEFGWNVVINNRGMTWRGLSDDVKGNVSANTINIIKENQSIIKRPIIVYINGDVTVGFTDVVREKLNG